MSFTSENNKERMKFVDFWAQYIRTHDDKTWSKQQNVIINSAINSANYTKEQYLKLKNWKHTSKY